MRWGQLFCFEGFTVLWRGLVIRRGAVTGLCVLNTAPLRGVSKATLLTSCAVDTKLELMSRLQKAVGRGTGKLQRKLEARRFPPLWRRQCFGENPAQKWRINTRHWKVSLECCSEPHNVSVQRSQQRGHREGVLCCCCCCFFSTLKLGVTQQVGWKRMLFNLPEAVNPARFSFPAPGV